MSEANQSIPPNPPQPQLDLVEPDEGMFRTYANHTRLGWTGFDIRIIFGELIEVTQEKITIEETAHVTLSWRQAKVLATSLSEIIQKYEEANGVLGNLTLPVGNA